MSEPRIKYDPDRLLLTAAIGLVLFLLARALFAQVIPAGVKLDPKDALGYSQAALGNRLGDYTLRDTSGAPVQLATYRGKPLIVSFVYTGCFEVCPATTQFLKAAVAEAQRVVGKDAFNIVTVGFNVPFDTPAAMRDFQRRQGVDLANWQFLAIDAPTLDGFARDVGFVWMPVAGGFDHLTQVTLVDPKGRVVRQVYGESFELPMLVAPLRQLVTGSQPPVQDLGNILERLRILCTVYDARTGRYRLDYALFIELFAGFTMLGGTAWYLTSEWRHHRATRTG